MLVKICGIKTEQAAKTAVTSGADFIGFVFAPSKRQITPETAASIAKTIPSTVQKVGVFVNETVEKMIAVAEKVGLDYIQLHGDETADIANQLPYKIIKAFPVVSNNLSNIKDYPCDYYLLDSPIGNSRGGNGTSFDWNLTKDIHLDSQKIFLAGGLTPDNVRKAIQLVNPVAVDVSSGVETNGVKDMMKIKEFITNVRKLDCHQAFR